MENPSYGKRKGRPILHQRGVLIRAAARLPADLYGPPLAAALARCGCEGRAAEGGHDRSLLSLVKTRT